MAVYRYIYVFLISIFTCISVATRSYAARNGKEAVYAGYSFKSNQSHHGGTSLLGKILSAADEGILVDHQVKTSAGSSQARDRDHLSIAGIVTSRWQISASALYFFVPPVRGQIEFFIPLVRLLIFPKHWFW